MKRSVIFSALALLALAVCWLLAYFCVGNGYILPSPWETAAAAGMLLAEGEFYLAFANTLLRTLAAFAASFFRLGKREFGYAEGFSRGRRGRDA